MRHSAQSFSGLTTTVEPVVGDLELGVLDAVLLAGGPFGSSSALIGRDASLMSVSPAQNFSKPPPVPEVPTVIWTPEFSVHEVLGRGLGQRGDRARAVDR